MSDDDFTPPYIYVGLCDEESVAHLPECNAHVLDYYARECVAGYYEDETTGDIVTVYSGANIGEWAVVSTPL